VVAVPGCNRLHPTVSRGKSKTTVVQSIYNCVANYDNDNILLGPPSSRDEGGMAVVSNSHTSGNAQCFPHQHCTWCFKHPVCVSQILDNYISDM